MPLPAEKGVELTKLIDVFLDYALHCRTLFPAVKADHIGTQRFITPPFYQKYGFNIVFEFANPLTAEDIAKINNIGHWLNQSFIIRLYALLNGYQVISDKKRIDPSLGGHEEIEILRQLRNVFAHSRGRYSPQKRKALYRKIIDHCNIRAEAPETASEFPLPIDKVLLPLAQGCKRYVEALVHQSQGE